MYKISERLGEGGMGIVYKARDQVLDRDVVLKMIVPERGDGFDTKTLLDRLRKEAQALCKLRHPNIVAVHAFRETEFGTFIVMEYVEGETLSERLVQNSLPYQDAVLVFKQLLDALDHAHQRKIYHCDIKPLNVMLTPSRDVRLMDFGLARKPKTSAQATLTTMGIGSPPYTPQEQWQGLYQADARSDIHALGMMIFRVFGTAEESEMIDGGIRPPTVVLRQDAPGDLRDIIAKAIEYEPSKRFQTASELKAALEEIDLKERRRFEEEQRRREEERRKEEAERRKAEQERQRLAEQERLRREEEQKMRELEKRIREEEQQKRKEEKKRDEEAQKVRPPRVEVPRAQIPSAQQESRRRKKKLVLWTSVVIAIAALITSAVVIPKGGGEKTENTQQQAERSPPANPQTNQTVQPSLGTMSVNTDLACDVMIDRIKRMTLNENETRELSIAYGLYEITARTTDGADTWGPQKHTVDETTVPQIFINLASVKAKRLGQ
jgi:serine/threonine protein kinase